MNNYSINNALIPKNSLLTVVFSFARNQGNSTYHADFQAVNQMESVRGQVIGRVRKN